MDARSAPHPLGAGASLAVATRFAGPRPGALREARSSRAPRGRRERKGGVVSRRLEMAPQRVEKIESCARPSWRDPAGESPAQVRGSARLLASVASSPAMARAKRTQQSCGVWD